MKSKLWVLYILGILMVLQTVFAANGDGVVLSYKPNVVSTGDSVTLQIELKNDASDGSCLDEIIIMPPDTWGGTASVTKYDRSTYSSTPEETNDNVNLVGDPQSVTIVPANMLCSGETVNIEIAGLVAPSNSETNPPSEIVIKTSDQNHNAGPSAVYATIDSIIPGKTFALPKVYVTAGTQLKLEYFHISGFSNTGFTGTAHGASARLKELYVKGQAGASIQVQINTNAGWQTIYTGGTLTGGVDTLVMNYAGWIPATMDTATLQSGYLQDGFSTTYKIILGTGTLQLKGEKEDIRNDPDYLSSGLTGAKGTIITAGSSEQRKINVQLVDDNGYDVNERIPLEVETDLGSIVETAPWTTDPDGNKYFTLNPGCKYGVANVKISTDPLKTTPDVTEYVGIDSNVQATFAVVEGDGAEVVGGESQKITVEVYDSCGNKVSNTHPQMVEFNYLTTTCGDINKLSQVPGGASNDYENENTDMGVADVYLNTECELCTHDVKITAAGLPGSPKTIQLQGVVGAPTKLVVTTDKNEIGAKGCVNATIKVTDACGNWIKEFIDPETEHIQQWESLTRVSIEKPLTSDQMGPTGYYTGGSTHIVSANLRNQEFSDNYVQGKLTLGKGWTEICGCQGLGQFKIVAKSDTLQDGNATVSVINAQPACIDVEVGDSQLLKCEESTSVDVGIKDVCGNYIIGNGCGYGPATSCVDLTLNGCDPDAAHLSTNTVCVDLKNNGKAPTATLFRDREDVCCDLNINAVQGQECCLTDFPKNLPQCEPAEITFVGEPDYMTTTFNKTRTDPMSQKEQVEGAIPNNGTETVSEEVLDLLTVYDACNNVVSDYTGTVDVNLKNTQCSSFIQVDHPLVVEGGFCQGPKFDCSHLTAFGADMCNKQAKCLWNSAHNVCGTNGGKVNCAVYNKEECKIIEGTPNLCKWIDDCTKEFPKEPTIVKKLVIDNCAMPCKQWTDMCENDIMVDKLAFKVNHEVDPALGLYVYTESGKTPGYQPGEDPLVGRAPVNWAGQTIMELEDTSDYYGADWLTRGVAWDDQREGGILIRAGESQDFYIMLVKHKDGGDVISCGEYSVDFLYYEDYTSADITNYGADTPFSSSVGGTVDDGCVNSDNFNWIGPGNQAPHPVCPYSGPFLNLRKDSRNDDYGHSTQDYGFGDTSLLDLKFMNGQAWLKFRDLKAEHVKVLVSDVQPDGRTCGENYRELESLDVVPNPEEITFISQPATQIVMINHDGFDPKEVSCGGKVDGNNSFLINLQTTDGFQNQHPKELPVALDYCLKAPFGDWMIEKIIEKACRKDNMCQGDPCTGDELDVCKQLYMDEDHCYTRQEFEQLLKDSSFGQYFGNVLTGDYFGAEFEAWLDSYFQNAVVEFRNPVTKALLPKNAQGKQYVTTDVLGRAQVLVTSPSVGYYKITATPEALDADYTFVSFKAGAPAKLDVMALPAFGIPADGEEEAMILLRALDKCNNVVPALLEDVTVRAAGKQVVISQDFEGKNNYNSVVTGEYVATNFAGCTKLAVLDDIPETATITASAPGLTSDSTQVVFQGAPVKLAITKIVPSDRIPADGETGAWVTVQVQDVNNNRVTGYKGQGFLGDPGDPWGMTDYTFENICVDLTAMGAKIPQWWLDIDNWKFGWTDFHQVGESKFCGNLMFGEGQIYVVMDSHECGAACASTVKLTVWDKEPFQGQEINENGIPSSDKATQLKPASGTIDFAKPATKWSIVSSKSIVAADGLERTLITIQVENPDFGVRQAVKANVLVSGEAELGATIAWVNSDSPEAPDPLNPGELIVDDHNPTSINVITNPVTGRAYLLVSSTKSGKAKVTVTGGEAYVCENRDDVKYQCPGRVCPDNDCEKVYEYWNCHYYAGKQLDTASVSVDFKKTFDNKLRLRKGWNFFSTPTELNVSFDQFGEIGLNGTCDATAYWNQATQAWVNPIPASTQIVPQEGYWCHVPADTEVVLIPKNIKGVSLPPAKAIVAKWNDVGLSFRAEMNMEQALMSIDKSYIFALDWDEGLQRYASPIVNTGELGGGSMPGTTGTANIMPSRGYFIWATGADTLVGMQP